jgi:Uma2 family endonuclease
MPTTVELMTAKEYLALPDNGRPTELVRGQVVEMNVPTPRHGQICSKIDRIVGNFAEEHYGHVITCDSGILTEEDPDTLRGADVAFYSYARVPRGPFPRGYLHVKPELVFEVRSQTDRWRDILAKVTEYLTAGVTAVCVIDEPTETAHVFRADEPPRIVAADEKLTFPAILGEFRVPVRRFLE